MSGRYKNGLVMLTCVALGALGGEALRAQIAPPAYLIGQIDVSDPDGYAKEYLPKAREIIKAHGGRLIAAAGAAATGSQVVAIDGEAPKRVVIYMYPRSTRGLNTSLPIWIASLSSEYSLIQFCNVLVVTPKQSAISAWVAPRCCSCGLYLPLDDDREGESSNY